MDRIPLPKEFNYVAAFLTLGCNFRCNYCINRPDDILVSRTTRPARDWLSYLNRLELPKDLPVTFQGGEPSQHPEFFEILKGVREDLHIDVLTNLSFDVERLVSEIPAKRFLRSAPYASIRVTYHPGQSNLEKTFAKLSFLKERGYPVGLYSIRVPGHEALIRRVQERARELGLDHRTKEYLGQSRGQVWGTYHYEGAVFSMRTSRCECRTSELLIAPDGNVHRCHRDLYRAENAIGTIDDHRPAYLFRGCDKFGECNPCDVKNKTDRFQVSGHASVEIRPAPEFS